MNGPSVESSERTRSKVRNPFGWIRDKLIERTVRSVLTKFFHTAEGGRIVDRLKNVIMWVVNLGGFLQGNRSQILIFVRVALQVLTAFGVNLHIDVAQVDAILEKLMTWTLVLKGANLAKSLKNGTSAATDGKGALGLR